MNLSIVEEHAVEAGFLWELRDVAAVAPHHDLGSLCELDERLEAHLDGLRVAGSSGVAVAAEASLDEPGAVFVAAVLATERSDFKDVARVLDATAAERPLGRALVSALGWVPWTASGKVVQGLLGARDPLLKRYGLAACAAHRVDPGAALGYAVLDRDAALRARALETAGLLGRADLAAEIRDASTDADAECRWAAAVAGALLGDAAAVEALWRWAEQVAPDDDPRRSERACAFAAVRTDPARAAHQLEAMAGWPTRERAALAGAAALGDPACMGWILERLASPAAARLAADAFAAITGTPVEGSLVGRAPRGAPAGPDDDPAHDDVAPDPDGPLPWPAADALHASWRAVAGSLRRGTRYLGGRPVEAELLARVLKSGGQRRRALAAFELAARQPGRPVFEVRAPGARQRASLG